MASPKQSRNRLLIQKDEGEGMAIVEVIVDGHDREREPTKNDESHELPCVVVVVDYSESSSSGTYHDNDSRSENDGWK